MRYVKITAFVCVVFAALAGMPQWTNAKTDGLNLAPTVNAKAFETLEEIPIWGYLEQYDPNGDEVTLSVVREAGKGLVTLYGSTFLYKPYMGETGTDSFLVVASDGAGKLSKEAEITIRIGENLHNESYADMRGDPSHYSALMLLQHDLAGGERIGSARLFHPGEEIKSAEFLMMLLAATGDGEELAPCVSVDVSNNDEISLWLKPYLQRARQLGVIGAGRFDPEKTLTRCEAVELVCRASGMEDVHSRPVYIEDVGDIPAESLQCYLNLSACGMLELYDGYARPNQTLTRGAAADLVWQLYRYRQSLAG